MLLDNPAVTVIVPAYNAEQYLSGCLDSISGQSFTDWELIIAEDGSSDRTGEIARNAAANDTRIRVISMDKKGVSAARNACIKAARGRYLAFVDADDLISPDYLTELYSHAEQTCADITQCSFLFKKEDGSEEPDPNGIDKVFSGRDEIIKACFRGSQGDIRVSVWAKLFRRDTFKSVCFDTDLRIYEDAYYVYECCMKAQTVCCFSAPLYRYMQHEGSTTHARLLEIYPDFFTMFGRQREAFKDNGTIRKQIAVREAETALWLMRIMQESARRQEMWDLRKKTLAVTGDVLSSSAPFLLKSKLTAVAVMPHIYFAMLKGRAGSEDT